LLADVVPCSFASGRSHWSPHVPTPRLAPTASAPRQGEQLAAPAAASAEPTANTSAPDQRTFALLAQLHGFNDPGEMLGTLHLQLTRAIGDPHIFTVKGLAQLVPQAEPYVAGTLIDASGASALTFSRLGDIDPSTTQVIFRVATTISSTVATHMIGNPNEFTAVFSTASGPTAVGQPRLAAPPEPDATATPSTTVVR
jgi:hypothetical protein